MIYQLDFKNLNDFELAYLTDSLFKELNYRVSVNFRDPLVRNLLHQANILEDNKKKSELCYLDTFFKYNLENRTKLGIHHTKESLLRNYGMSYLETFYKG